MSDTNTNNASVVSQPPPEMNQVAAVGDDAAAVVASNSTSTTTTPTSLPLANSTVTDLSASATIPSNLSSTNIATANTTTNTTVPSPSSMAPRETSSNSTNTTTAAATTTTTMMNPTGNTAAVTTSSSTTTAAPARTVPILKKPKKRVKVRFCCCVSYSPSWNYKSIEGIDLTPPHFNIFVSCIIYSQDTSIGKDTNDSGNPVKKKVRKVNRNSTGGSGAGRANSTANNGANAGSSTSASNTGITSHHNHPNMPSIHHNGLIVHDGLSPAQQAAQEQMRRALEEDQYSLVGSIIDHNNNNNDSDNYDDDDATDDGDHPYTNYTYNYRGAAVRLDKAAMIQAVRKYILLEQRLQNSNGTALMTHGMIMNDHDDEEDEDDDGLEDDDDDVDGTHFGDSGGTATRRGGGTSGNNNANHNKMTNSNGNNNANNKKKKRKDELTQLQEDVKSQNQQPMASKDPLSLDPDDEFDRDGGSIFGATTGQSNSTWVECDKCKKWRRLRGVVDEKKLPSKWYCSMNKNDPERARCSAPEEEYETSHTPESAADSRTRKHLRVWVRRLQCNEAYESRQPTLTRGKKRNAVSASSTNPYEWVRCCNPSCGKWRALLRIMDAKGSVVDRTTDGEWYCVMNNWDEKMASCAAPQENLPAVGCPPWVMQDGK